MAERLRLNTLETQGDIFRLAERDHGLTRKIISSKSGIKYDALGTYARGEHVMPLDEVLKLFDAVPDYLLSRLLDPVGRHFAPNCDRDGDLEDLGREAASFTNEFVQAVTDGNVTPIERARLRQRAKRLASTADAASA